MSTDVRKVGPIVGFLPSYTGYVTIGNYLREHTTVTGRHGPFMYVDEYDNITTYGYYYKSRYHGLIWRNGGLVLYINGKDVHGDVGKVTDETRSFVELKFGATIQPLCLETVLRELRIYTKYKRQLLAMK